MRASALFLAATLSFTPAIADDGAASIAAGGLVMRREPRITMAKEVLTISTRKVTVDYDFRNDTDADITTEVAFPIPPYRGDDERHISEIDFNDFKLWVDGKPVTYSTDTRAFVGRRDVTNIPLANHLDIESLGGETSEDFTPIQIEQLPAAARDAFVRQRLLVKLQDGGYFANWSVHKRFYWRQTFPARATIHVRHEYTPVVGYSQLDPELLNPTSLSKARDASERAEMRFSGNEFTSLCPSPAAVEKLSHANGIIEPVWVDFILTTANTWKRPIEDFTLIVERPDPKSTVRFCWDGPVEQLDANHFQAHATDLIPTKQLHIGFYQLLPPEKP